MGNPSSKVKLEAPETASIPSVPILTPQKPRVLDIDPRSPSENIVRTPIEVLSAGKANKYEIATTKILSFDPRSPTVEFTRTPIVVENSTNGVKLRNKNLDNVRKQLVNVTPMKESVKIGPKLLESSPLLPSDVKKRNSIVGLLETNIDYVETDLDSVPLKNSNNSLKAKFLGVDLDLVEDSAEEANEAKEIVVDAVQHVSAELDDLKICEALPNDTDITAREQQDVEESALKHDVVLHELDKKLSNLIYEDKHILSTPTKTTKLKENRTPLGVRNSNGNVKSISKLRVHDKPTLKADYVVSKIPIFKEKKGKGKLNVQCENTPPARNFFDNQSLIKKSHWDGDNTLII